MKTSSWIAIPMGMVLLAGLGAYVGPLLFAQERPAAKAAPSKVALVNIRAVLKENPRARALQTELEDALKPHRARAETLSKQIDAMKWNTDGYARKKAEWDAVNAEIIRLIEAKHKEKLPAVWEEVNEAITAIARAYGFQVVLGFGDPDDPEMRKLHGARASKLQMTDLGGTVAAYVHSSVDITPVVIRMLAPKAGR